MPQLTAVYEVAKAIKGKGVPDAKGQPEGDLYVKLLIQIPGESSERARRAIDLLETCYDENPRKQLAGKAGTTTGDRVQHPAAVRIDARQGSDREGRKQS